MSCGQRALLDLRPPEFQVLSRSKQTRLLVFVANNDYYDHNWCFGREAQYEHPNVDRRGGEGEIQRVDRQSKIRGPAKDHQAWAHDRRGGCGRRVEPEDGAQGNLAEFLISSPL